MSFKSEENGTFRGIITFINAILNTGCVGNDQVKVDAEIDALKLEHQHRPVYAQESATTAVDAIQTVHVVVGQTGTLLGIKAGSVVANIGDSTVTIDLLKNGVSVLTATFDLDSGDAAYALVAGTIDSPDTVVVGDVLEVSVNATIGTGTLATGVFVYVDIKEDFD